MEPAPPRDWRGVPGAFAIGVAAALLCAWQAGRLGVTWDEALSYFPGCRALAAWWALGAPLDPFELSRALHRDMHPPLIKLLGCASHALTPDSWPDWYRWRLATPVLFGVACGTVFLALRREAGVIAALCACACLLGQPRLLADASLLTTDAPLACFCLIGLVALGAAGSDARWLWVLDLAIAGAVLTKLSGLCLVASCAAACLLLRRPRWLLHVGGATAVGLALLVLLYPPWEFGDWFGHLGMHRARPIDVFFLGERVARPPFTWVWVMLFAVTPLGVLLAILVGVAALAPGVRARDPWSVVLACAIGPWLVLFMTPLAPRHDGIRQALFLFAALGLAGGIGVARLLERLPATWDARKRTAAAALAVALPLSGLIAWIRSQPVPHSSYGGQVGGLSGAARLGLETTYWWDALDLAAWREVDALLPAGARVSTLIASGYLEEAQRLGLLRRDVHEVWPEEADWYLALHRRSMLDAKVQAALDRSDVLRAWSAPGAPEVTLVSLRRVRR